MENKITEAAAELQKLWVDLCMESVQKIQLVMKGLAENAEVCTGLRLITRTQQEGYEIFRDRRQGFILLAYSEKNGVYRIPHNHGEAWVVYAMVSGAVEMGNYFNAVRGDVSNHLVLKNREKLIAGDTRIYLPGEIHDTRCVSEEAVILRLTSLDLRAEESAGRMRRFR